MNQRLHKRAENSPSRLPSNQITVIIPTRNEAGNIALLLDKLAALELEPALDVLVIDDSTDNTAQIVSRIAENSPLSIQIRVRTSAERNGLSGAVVEGLYAARGNWVCVMDADLQHPPEAIPLMWEQGRRTGADMVVGSRRGDLFGPSGLTRMRSFTSKALTILARMVFPRTLKNVSDPLTGLFLLRRSAVSVDALQPDGFKILLEILVRCPSLHVTEIQFDFAPRNDGESKADVREGMRFFRHLLRLRITVNPHLVRFLVVVLLGAAGNTLLLWALVAGIGLQVLVGSIVAAELFFFGMQISFHYWVFRDQEILGLRRGFWTSFLASQFFLIIVYLPVILFLSNFFSLHYLLINIAALSLVGLIRYGLSEQWIWTKGSMIWQHQTHYYHVHGIINIASQVPLDELKYFKSSQPLPDVDIQIRLDRHGTPSHFPGGISYDERLGRFGFGLTVVPGDFTQIVVSPLLERSPNFLFTNIVEPVLRWCLVRKNYALIKAASVSRGNGAILLQSKAEMGGPVALLCDTNGYAFMGDDIVIVNDQGLVFGYPKPLTVQQEMVKPGRSGFSSGDRLKLVLRRAVYTQFSRKVGLWLSGKNIPAATINTYLQWFVPQPKQMLAEIMEDVPYADAAQIKEVIAVGQEEDWKNGAKNLQSMIKNLQLSEEKDSFQPHPLIAKELRSWEGEDLLLKERSIIENALIHSSLRWLPLGAENWWQKLDPDIENKGENEYQKTNAKGIANQNEHTIYPWRGTGIL